MTIIIVAALEAGVDVITEKPMATTAAEVPAHPRCRAPHRPARRCRASTTASRRPRAPIKELLVSGVIGDVVSVDFHWYLDVQHGADYFRRWHAERREFRQPVRPQGDASFRPAELVSRLRSGGGVRARRARPLRPATDRSAARAAGAARTRARATTTSTSASDPWLDMLYEAPSARTAISATPACSARRSTSPTR